MADDLKRNKKVDFNEGLFWVENIFRIVLKSEKNYIIMKRVKHLFFIA